VRGSSKYNKLAGVNYGALNTYASTNLPGGRACNPRANACFRADR
jgi:hypothetical protein